MHKLHMLHTEHRRKESRAKMDIRFFPQQLRKPVCSQGSVQGIILVVSRPSPAGGFASLDTRQADPCSHTLPPRGYATLLLGARLATRTKQQP